MDTLKTVMKPTTTHRTLMGELINAKSIIFRFPPLLPGERILSVCLKTESINTVTYHNFVLVSDKNPTPLTIFREVLEIIAKYSYTPSQYSMYQNLVGAVVNDKSTPIETSQLARSTIVFSPLRLLTKHAENDMAYFLNDNAARNLTLTVNYESNVLLDEDNRMPELVLHIVQGTFDLNEGEWDILA